MKKYRVDIDGVRYPKDGLSNEYASNDYVDQFRDLEILYKEYAGEELLCPFISYTDMKSKYPIHVNLDFKSIIIFLRKVNYLNNIDVLLILLD